jgi:hypothetical protein
LLLDPRGWDQLIRKRLPKHAQTDLPAETRADFGNVHGSSTFNKLMVDHRLAAIVKTCFKKKEKLLEPLKIAHFWRW